VRCSLCEPLLDAYLEGTLRPRQARAVAVHLRGCSVCAALLQELRVVDALLTTARPPRVQADITDAVVSATATSAPREPRQVPLWLALLLYLATAWALAAIAIFRFHDLSQLAGAALAFAHRDLTALGAAVHALAPETPVAAAAVTTVLLIDLLLVGATFYGYRRLRPMLATYLDRGERR
jgi:anti-sigma factor RsiW